ncbi:putative oxidoreductase SERP2049 [Planktothrix tepida]|nr:MULTISPECIES: SDR family oxidoreductase [Planktothrix]CAD5920011.1 putative oxidoreductase SERP2049 [Planktothrix tepida]CAD5983565.1 putative oxidoreductase SERP2049 [Planktothrix pseudagardhii]
MNHKVVVIVGATGGIGATVARKLAQNGTKLVLAARNSTKLETLAKNLETTEVLPVSTDITDPQQVEGLMQKTADYFGQIDILVNAAGAGILKQWNKIEPADLDAMLNLNLKGSVYTCQAAANIMKQQKSGHICNVVGILGKHSMAMSSAYCASKFGLVGFSKCFADEVRRYGIKVTLFYFGGVDTPFWDNVSLKVDRSKMLSAETAANSILYALSAEPQAIPMEINIQPESHLFF